MPNFRQRAEAIASGVDSEKTYTFCFWGCSRFANILTWQLCGVSPKPVSLSSVIGNWPTHFVCYELRAHKGHARHSESRKRYLFDAIGWSGLSDNSAQIAAQLQQRYDGLDIARGTVRTGPLKETTLAATGAQDSSEPDHSSPSREDSQLASPAAIAEHPTANDATEVKRLQQAEEELPARDPEAWSEAWHEDAPAPAPAPAPASDAMRRRSRRSLRLSKSK